MSGLELNKIAAAILLAGLIAMIVGTVGDSLYHDHVMPEKRGFQIEGVEEVAAAGAAPADTGPVDILPFLSAADAAAGANVLKRCTTCHTFEKGGANKVGPNLYGIVGNHHAHQPDFAYSEAFVAVKDKKWDFQSLSDYIANPKKAIPGNKMAFAGISKPKERADLIAHLNTLRDGGPLPIPKVAPPAADAAAPAEAAATGATAPADVGAAAKPADDKKPANPAQPEGAKTLTPAGGNKKPAPEATTPTVPPAPASEPAATGTAPAAPSKPE